ncbi:MAG: hypothetical protein ABJZ55_00115 [Fuerstiella sp.]
MNSVSKPVPFAIQSERECTNVPVTTGLCLPKGHIFDVASADITIKLPNETSITAATKVLNRWHNGSVRWVQVDFVAPKLPIGQSQAAVTFRSKNQPISTSVDASLSVKGRSFLLELGDRKVLIDPTITDQHGQSLQLSTTAVTQTKQSAQRQSWNAELSVDGHSDIEIGLTFDIWPSTGIVDVSTRIRNRQRAIHAGGLWDLGDSGSFHFNELSVKLSSSFAQNSNLTFSLDGESQISEQGDGPFHLVQYSSGGPAWNSSNHVNGQNQSTVTKNGFQLQVGNQQRDGLQASPTVCMSNEQSNLQVAVPEFWQQFPGSMTCDPARGTASVSLFPAETEETFELQGGEQKTKRFVFSIDADRPQSSHSSMSWVHKSPRIIPDSDWVRSCNVIPWLPDTQESANQNSLHHNRLTEYLTAARSNECSLDKRRDKIDEYGWRNFGEIHADHEQTHFAGTSTVVSHYNNQFDLIFGAIQNLIVSGDATWYDLFDPMARHVIDIDIYHTDQDRACFNGGLFWHTDHYVDAKTATHRTYSGHNAGEGPYGGGPSNEHNYPTGLLYYYFLTGNVDARDSVLSLADWVINMDDGRQTLFGAIDGGDTGLASKTVRDDFHGPGRGVGNSINACLDGWLLTADSKYMAKAEQLILRCVHPEQDCDALHLADAEGHWSYTVCLTALGRYLHVKAGDDQLDETYEYVRQTLVHYGNWMATNEKPSLSIPEDLEYPTEAWAAQDIRKANALKIAASCCADADQKSAMNKMASTIYETAWNDLYRFGKAHLSARCFSILMTEGLRQLHHGSPSSNQFPASNQTPPAVQWRMFELQKDRVKSTVKNPLQLLKAIFTNLRFNTVRQSLDAFKRQTKS